MRIETKIHIRSVYLAVALASLAFMVWNAENNGFWYDEFVQICYSGLDQTILDSLLVLDPTPPLFNVLANIWYDLVPYGERWLLLLPQLAMTGAVYVSALWGELLGGKYAGLWSAILLGTSQMVIEQCGFEFRGYGFYLLFSTLAYYFHALLMEKENSNSRKYVIFFGLALTGLLYSHLFGTLIFAALAGIDGLLVRFRKLSRSSFLIYAVSGALFLPWVIYYCVMAGRNALNARSSWMCVPSLWDVIKLAAYLCGNHIVVCLMFVVGVFTVFVDNRKALHTHSYDVALIRKLVPLVIVTFMVTAVFLYGHLRTGYESLWVKRYFTGLFPGFAVVCALGAVRIMSWTEGKRLKRLLPIVGMLLIVPISLVKTASGNTPLGVYYHREITELLYRQEDIWEDGTIVLTTCPGGIDGWEEYYCERLGRRRCLDIHSIYGVDPAELAEKEIVYFDYNFWEENSRPLETRQILEQQFTACEEWKELRLTKYEK